MDQLFEVSIAAVLVAVSIGTVFFFSQTTAAEHVPGLLFRVSTLLCMLFVRECSTILRLVLCTKQSMSIPSSRRITPPCEL